MGKWTADFTNDPFNDYNLITEILLDGEEVAVIKSKESNLRIIWYSSEKEMEIPFDWLLGLMLEAKKRMQADK